MGSLGWTHVAFAVVALVVGGLVLGTRKGTRWHRTLGHGYVTSMVGLNVTALFLYRLTGGFNVFHVFALLSLTSVVAGMAPVLLRRPMDGWLHWHARLMSGSYVGLLAAASSEVVARVPGLNFGGAVGLATLSVTLIGVYLLQRWLPSSVARVQR